MIYSRTSKIVLNAAQTEALLAKADELLDSRRSFSLCEGRSASNPRNNSLLITVHEMFRTDEGRTIYFSAFGNRLRGEFEAIYRKGQLTVLSGLELLDDLLEVSWTEPPADPRRDALLAIAS